jgi:hypothetical protein
MSQNTENKYVSKEEFNSLLQVVTKNIEYISILKSTLDKLSSYTVSLEKRLQLVEMKSDDIHYAPLEDSDHVSGTEVSGAEVSGAEVSGVDASGTDSSLIKESVEDAPQKVRKTESDDVYIDLSNSQVFESSELYATKMCKSVMKGDKCSFGPKCSFAHSINQLRRKECLYPNCYNVKALHHGVFINTGNKMCEFWHKDETQASYAKRLRIPYIAMTTPVPPKQPIKPSILMTDESSVLDSSVYNKIRGQALYGFHEYMKGCDCPACDGNLKDRCD